MACAESFAKAFCVIAPRISPDRTFEICLVIVRMSFWMVVGVHFGGFGLHVGGSSRDPGARFGRSWARPRGFGRLGEIFGRLLEGWWRYLTPT